MKKFLYILLIPILLVSCDNRKENPLVDTGIIQPLAVGYHWEYVDSMFSTYGEFLSSDTSFLSIEGKKTIEFEGMDTEVFFWCWNYNGSGPVWLCNSDETGFYHYGGTFDGNDFILAKSLNMKYPVKLNESWDTYNFEFVQSASGSYFEITDTSTIVCNSKNVKIKTSLGDVDCISYKMIPAGYEGILEIYISNKPGIGFVQYERKFEGITVFKKSLISYELTESLPEKSTGIRKDNSCKSTENIFDTNHFLQIK